MPGAGGETQDKTGLSLRALRHTALLSSPFGKSQASRTRVSAGPEAGSRLATSGGAATTRDLNHRPIRKEAITSNG